jgi:mRNA interferase MazF
MNPGDVVLISLPQWRGGTAKLRPALLLAVLPGPYQNILVCGISTQLAQQVTNWDEGIATGDADFATSGLHQQSIIRLSYLYAADRRELVGSIGSIERARLDRLLTRLADHLAP